MSSQNVLIDSTSVRSFNELTKAEKQEVNAKLETVNYKDPGEVIAFAAEYSHEITELSTEMISVFQTNDYAEANDLIVEVISELSQLIFKLPD